jgi:hypothetical protein
MRACCPIVRLLRTLCLVAVLFAIFSPDTRAHSLLTDHVEHRMTVTADRRNIDIHLELTFHDMRSLLERRRIDADRNGIITRVEANRYLAAMADTLEDGIIVTCAGTRLNAAFLDDPQLDLENDLGTLGARHLLRLSWFVRTPPDMSSDRFEIEDRLWSAAAASCTAGAGRSVDMCVTAPPGQLIWLPHKDRDPRVVTFSVRPTPVRASAVSFQLRETHHATATRPGENPVLRHPAGPRRLERR